MGYGYDKPIEVSDRTGKKTVAIVGFAPSTRHLAPWDDLKTEIWGINEAYVPVKESASDPAESAECFMKRWTRWFQLHSLGNFTRPGNWNDFKHYDWLKAQKDFPIYMQKKYYEIPASVPFPIQEALALAGHRYFTSTMAYLMALAMLEKFERIELYGFEMASGTEYAHQRACGEYWMGRAEGAGIELYLPPVCGLLKDKLYAYSQMSIGYRQRLEMRSGNIKTQLDKAIADFNKMKGMLEAYDAVRTVVPEGDIPRAVIDEIAVKQKAEAQTQGSVVNVVNGAHQESMQAIKFYDEYPFENDEGDVHV